MNLKSLFIGILLASVVSLLSTIGYSQKVKPGLKADSLFFSLLNSKRDITLKDSNLWERISPQLNYDFEFQYPYYRLTLNKFKVGDQIQFRFSQLPQKGFLYAFSVDGTNNIKPLPSIKIDSRQKTPLMYPDSSKALTFETTGMERICLWYSTDSLPNVHKLIKGIELTYGNFIFRANGQLGTDLLLPSMGWHLYSSKLGFVIDPQLFPLASKFILAVIIEFEVTNQ